MSFSQSGGDLGRLEGLAAAMRAGLDEAGHMVGQQLVRQAREGILNGAKSGRVYDTLFFTIGTGPGRRVISYGSRGAHQASAPGEYSANDTGNLVGSIDYTMSGDTLSFHSTSPHAGFQEEGTDRMAARPNLLKAIEDSDGIIRNLLEQIIWRALAGAG